MPEEQTTRRRFLTAALVFSGVGSTLGSGWLRSAAAWADGAELDTLAQMAGRLFPHAGLDDSVYGAIMSDVLNEAATDTVTVVGPICETGDRLGSDRLLPRSYEDDIILIANAGAYGYVMRLHYNRRADVVEVVI